MKYQKSPISEMFEDGNIILATHKGVSMDLDIGKDYASIYSVESKNEGKGEAQEAIEILKKDHPDKKLHGSVPLNPVMKHIFDKLGVLYYES